MGRKGNETQTRRKKSDKRREKWNRQGKFTKKGVRVFLSIATKKRGVKGKKQCGCNKIEPRFSLALNYRTKKREPYKTMSFTPIFPLNFQQITEQEAEAWAAELDEQCASIGENNERGGWQMQQEYKEEYKMPEEYNEWHTLDDHLDYGALLRGIHNIQERGGTGKDEKRFLDNVCDRFGHKRFELN